ncbi:MAG: hypothetical protein EKK62_05705 [Acidimicrobiia bacterium]|nr:MAG: hypothetical protein EKK62_05705 [Acidimicrobiia bacterium]
MSFKAAVPNHVWFEIADEVQEAERHGEAMPEPTIAVTLSYRGGQGTRTLTLSGGAGGGATLFPDDLTIPGAGYVSTSWTGFFPEMTST